MSTGHKTAQSNPSITPVPPNHRPAGVGIVRNPDGSYTRHIQFPNTPATPDPNSHSPVLSKDTPINPQNQTWARIYLPREVLGAPSSTRLKLPLVVYYHGGGFVFLSAKSTIIHDFCVKMVTDIDVVVVSVNYRLAPEHRLPAAYEDAVEALHWIKTTEDKWLTEFADVSNCFLMGTSAGGNIAYHAGLSAAADVDEYEPLKIKGLILHHSFFGGCERTGSELGPITDPILTISGLDHMWNLSLPTDADRDHEYCNPTAGGGSINLKRVGLLGWRILVTGGYDDPLIDRQVELAKILKEKGLRTVVHFGKGYHSVELFDDTKAKELFVILKIFTSSSWAD